jgi:hypothetical protein
VAFRDETDFADIAHERELALVETSVERFDRIAFAKRALDLVRPPRTTVALCEGTARVHVESGRVWGRAPDARWAVLTIPPRASRRAIVIAVAGLAQGAGPYALDVLLASGDERH